MAELQDSKQATEHFAWLDILRFFAALVVVVGHTRSAVFVEWASLAEGSKTPLVAIFFALTRLGHEAVIVFFVLSGFLVGGRAITRMSLGSFLPNDYAIDRATRIMVPLIPALLISGLLAENHEGTGVWIGNLLGLQGVLVPTLGGNGPLWSLAYEIWFYIMAYAVGRQASKREFDLVSVILLIASLFVFSRLQFHYLFCWLLGAYFYVKRPTASSWLIIPLALVLCFVGLVGIQSRGVFSNGLEDVRGLKAIFELTLALGGALLCSSLIRLPRVRFDGVFVHLAGFSYTLYLIHAPVLLWIARHFLVKQSAVDVYGLAIFTGLAVLFLLVSWLLYMVFERNTAWVRRKLKHGFKLGAAAVRPRGC